MRVNNEPRFLKAQAQQHVPRLAGKEEAMNKAWDAEKVKAMVAAEREQEDSPQYDVHGISPSCNGVSRR